MFKVNSDLLRSKTKSSKNKWKKEIPLSKNSISSRPAACWKNSKVPKVCFVKLFRFGRFPTHTQKISPIEYGHFRKSYQEDFTQLWRCQKVHLTFYSALLEKSTNWLKPPKKYRVHAGTTHFKITNWTSFRMTWYQYQHSCKNSYFLF